MSKLARRSFKEPWVCQKPWPEDCGVQCGDRGVVFVRSTGESYMTAFFEAFPEKPHTFLRGEGTTIEEAEQDAWDQFARVSACDHPEFERRTYRNGLGFCVKCGMSKSNAFEPLDRCCICDTPTYYSTDNKGRTYCEAHYSQIADEDKHPWQRAMEEGDDE